MLLDARGEGEDLAGGDGVREGERELRLSCWGRSGLEGGKIRSRRALCIVTVGFAWIDSSGLMVLMEERKRLRKQRLLSRTDSDCTFRVMQQTSSRTVSPGSKTRSWQRKNNVTLLTRCSHGLATTKVVRETNGMAQYSSFLILYFTFASLSSILGDV